MRRMVFGRGLGKDANEKKFSCIYEFIVKEGKFNDEVIENMKITHEIITKQNKQLLELSKKVNELYNLCSK